MRNCSVDGCVFPVHGTDKITRIGYCHSHQYLRTDIDRRSSFQKHISKQKESNSGNNTSLSNLIDDLDFVFSRYIRLKYADENGYVKCFTCPEFLFWKEIENGHYVSRSNQATRFLEDNCRPQCGFCNSRQWQSIRDFASLFIVSGALLLFDVFQQSHAPRGIYIRSFSRHEALPGYHHRIWSRSC